MAETIGEIKDKIYNTAHMIGRRYAAGEGSGPAFELLTAQLNRLVSRVQIEERKKR